jgi:hypothetical protein
MNLAPTDPLAVRLTTAVRSGALDELARLLDEQPQLANARITGRRGGQHRHAPRAARQLAAPARGSVS